MSIFAPLLIYVSALATLCGSIVLAAAMLIAAPNAPVATDGNKAAPIPGKLTRAANRSAVQSAKTGAETTAISLVTPAAASVAAPIAPLPSAQQNGVDQKRPAASRKKPVAIARSRPPRQPALGYAATPDFEPPFFARGR
jgi:hypothetical protein